MMIISDLNTKVASTLPLLCLYFASTLPLPCLYLFPTKMSFDAPFECTFHLVCDL